MWLEKVLCPGARATGSSRLESDDDDDSDESDHAPLLQLAQWESLLGYMTRMGLVEHTPVTNMADYKTVDYALLSEMLGFTDTVDPTGFSEWYKHYLVTQARKVLSKGCVPEVKMKAEEPSSSSSALPT